ncbi:MAG TPA: DUF3015 family protein [Nitrospiria bacterium]|jgi:hypothetical protein
MKKLVLLGAMAGILFSVPSVYAVGKHPMAGCGLAYFLFAKDNNSKGIQILAGTTNGFMGTQTFGITSGTSGCTEDGALAFNKEIEVYASINLTNLSEEMAKGEGEYVTAFAYLLGANDETVPVMLRFFQEKYISFFPSEETNSLEMLDALRAELLAHPEFLG